jgi:hypothetical protein
VYWRCYLILSYLIFVGRRDIQREPHFRPKAVEAISLFAAELRPSMVKPSMIRPSSSRITTTKSLVTATMLLYAPAPHIEDTVQSSLEHHYRQRLLCQHLEQCYTQSLEPLKKEGVPEAPSSAESQAPTADSQAAHGESAELASIASLSQRLTGIRASTGHTGRLWGVELADESAARSSLLAAFLRAREWDVESADTFLRETLTWRRENGVEGSSGSSGSSALSFPDDTIHHRRGTGSDGQPRTVVVIRLGQVTLEGTNPA